MYSQCHDMYPFILSHLPSCIIHAGRLFCVRDTKADGWDTLYFVFYTKERWFACCIATGEVNRIHNRVYTSVSLLQQSVCFVIDFLPDTWRNPVQDIKNPRTNYQVPPPILRQNGLQLNTVGTIDWPSLLGLQLPLFSVCIVLSYTLGVIHISANNLVSLTQAVFQTWLSAAIFNDINKLLA